MLKDFSLGCIAHVPLPGEVAATQRGPALSQASRCGVDFYYTDSGFVVFRVLPEMA